MKKEPSVKAVLRRIDRRLKALGLSENKASEMAGSRDTIRNIRRNATAGKQRGVTTETIQRLAPVLRTTPEWLLNETGLEQLPPGEHLESSAVLAPAEPPDRQMVDVVGYVGAGARAHRYAVGQGGFDRVPAPDDATDSTVAVEIRGDSLGELFDRWLVFYDEVRCPITADLIGKLCVVGLPDDSVLIKKVRRSRKEPGLFDLLSNTEAPIEGVQILWAARVKNMVPR